MHAVEPPLAGHTLEGVDAAIGEVDTRPGDEVLDRAGDEHLPRLSNTITRANDASRS